MAARDAHDAAIGAVQDEVANLPMPLAMTECHLALPGRNRCEVLSTWAAGVANARLLHVNERHGDKLKIATLADFCGTRWQVNAVMIPAPRGRSYMMPVALVMSLYRHHTGEKAVRVAEAPVDLDVTASRTGSRFFVHVVNTNRRRDASVVLRVTETPIDSGRVLTLVADPEVEVIETEPDVVSSRETPLPPDGLLTFPAASVSAVELDVQEAGAVRSDGPGGFCDVSPRPTGPGRLPMKLGTRTLMAVVALCAGATAPGSTRAGAEEGAAVSRDYPVQPVPFTAVHFEDSFWLPRIEVNRTVTIPFAFEKCEESKRVYNFERAAAVLRGEKLADTSPPGYPFDDTDVYKVIEGAAYTLSVKADPKLEAYLDGLIEKIAAAQEKDGYLYTTRTINPESPHRWAGKERWELEKEHGHELYNLGHLYEAAVAHYQATGKRTLLDVALRSAELLDRTFGPGKRSIWPGHQITEMGLVKLYRVTGDARYLALAKFLLDQRGPDGTLGAGRTYNQSHERVVEQSEAVGHAVRATYMYSGMADVAALTGEKSYVEAMDRIWHDVVDRKLYLTGGIGSTSSGEAFGLGYELPNMSAYNETCAAIGNDFWNHRLFLLHGDSRYVDVMERTLYNGLLSGVSLDGRSFFYPNPLESAGQHQRSPWFGVACCPGNMTRFLASVPGYVYAKQDDTIYVNLFVASTAAIELHDGRKVKLVQETRYPWDGAIRITVSPERAGPLKVRVRIPGWARGEAVPSDLYRFADRSDEEVSLRVNGQPTTLTLDKGYAALERSWKAGDVIELHLPMPVRRVAAHPSVEADQGRVALQRGPLVYAAEWPDNPGGKVRNLLLPDGAALASEFRPGLLNGVQVVTGRAVALAYDTEGRVTKREQDFTAIPYYAWANRGPGEMLVWLPNREASARPRPLPTLASRATVTSSPAGHDPRAVNDQSEPRSSRDPDSSFFHWWPEKGSTEWVEYAFAQPSRVSEVQVYWFDDAGSGECRTPASWRVLYRDGEEWRPVRNRGPYGVEKDRYNTVAFEPVTTSGLRLEVVLPPEWSSGILEWKVQ